MPTTRIPVTEEEIQCHYGAITRAVAEQMVAGTADGNALFDAVEAWVTLRIERDRELRT